MSKAKKYRVWFDQINQTYFDVVGESKECAVSKARKEWMNNYSYPDVSDIMETDIEDKPLSTDAAATDG